MVNFYTGNKPTPDVSDLELFREYKAEQKKKHGSVWDKRLNTVGQVSKLYKDLAITDNASNQVTYVDEAMLDVDAPVSNIAKKPAPSNRKITVREHHLWKASGIKTYDEYLSKEPQTHVEFPKWPRVKDLPGLPGGADDPDYLESLKEREEEHLRRVRKYGRRELEWGSHLL